MRRSNLQKVFFIGGWTLAFLGCLFTGLAAYMVGYFDGREDSRPRRIVPITSREVLHAVGFALNETLEPRDRPNRR